MKRYAIIAAALLLGVGCQSRNHETSSTMEPAGGTSYGTPGMGTQSGSSSSSSSVFDSSANHRNAVQDSSSALKDRQATPDTPINSDIGTPGLNYDKGAAAET